VKEILSKGFEYHASIYSLSSISSIEKTLDLPHIAFFGSSNAGKSSLISNLCGIKNLAFSSKTPGKTKEIILFTSKHPFFHKKIFLVDFPGYGYAKASNSTLKQWEAIPEFINQTNIKKSYILIPAQKELLINDISLINILQNKQFCIVLTKCDKSSTGEISQKQELLRQHLRRYPNFTGQVFLTSTKVMKNMQNTEIIQEIFDIFKNHINGI
jgi:GTP-binding protein